MTEATPVANFEGMSGFRTVVYDAANVEEDVWREVQELHRDSLLARLPEGERYRADVLTSWDDPRSYQASRANPNVLVGIEFNDDQIYRRPKLATVLDLSGQMVAAALTADNSSADRLPKRLRPYEARVKMHVRPSMNIPIIGGKRYDHLRDAFSRADAQTGQENELGQRIVNGVVLAAIYHSLAEVYPEQDLADYVAIEDPADAEMTDITAI